MRISATEEYGLRCILQLARLGSGEQLAASQIAEREGISVQYASKIMHLFRKATLVEAERGLHGGFRLSLPAEEISLARIFASLNSEAEPVEFCNRFAGDRNECVHMGECSVRPIWQVLLGYFNSVLTELRLSDLVNSERDAEILIRRKSQKFSDSVHLVTSKKTNHEVVVSAETPAAQGR